MNWTDWWLSVSTRNWLYFLAAWFVSMITVGTDTSLPPSYPLYLTSFEALGMTIAVAIPAFIAQFWLKDRRVYHHWTLILALVGAFGQQYAASH